MKSESTWQSVQIPRFPKVNRRSSYDVVIVGGGLTGLTTAYLLKRAGKKVCVLERDRLASGDTVLTTAHLTYVTDVRPSELVKNFGEKGAALVLEAGSIAINTIESIVNEEKIQCDFQRVPGFLFASLRDSKDERKQLRADADACRRLKFPVQFIEQVPYFKRPGVRFPDQAKFHPLKYLAALARAVDGDGCAIFERSEVTEVRDDPIRAVVNRHTIEAKYVVIATYVPLMGKTGLVSATLFQTKLYPYSSYVIGARIPKGLMPIGCFWDTSDPYYYVRVEEGTKTDYVIFGGEDHKTGQKQNTRACFQRLQDMLMETIPEAKPDRQWSGQVIETNDGLPYIGETSKNQFVTTGFSGNGMTFGTVAAIMACDAALGTKNRWQKLFAISRKKVRGGLWDYLTENVDFPYYFVKDRLARTMPEKPEALEKGEGGIFEIRKKRVACSRGKDGKLVAVSPYCTHMGCLVRWNQAEHTWDCPCHGSRFRASGEVMAGPAETDLESVGLGRRTKKDAGEKLISTKRKLRKRDRSKS